MLTLPPSVRIYLAPGVTDLRRSIDGLMALTRDRLGLDPVTGHLFLFRNRRGDRLKILAWDRSGFWVLYNQPSSHYTSFDSTRGPWWSLCAARSAAARSRSRSQRLQCFAGRVAGSS